jgi:glycosyltransferase involved in cell wall biosynthesis
VPRVSVAVPVYNGARLLPETLDSLLAQTYRDFELIVCDNASTDDTERVCRDYAARDARVRYERNATNIGVDRNFNLGFALARGEYFKWAPADDLNAPTLLERCVELLDRRPEAVLAYPKTRLIDGRGAPLRDWDDEMDIEDATPNARLAHFLWHTEMCNVAFGVIRADAVRRTALYGSFSNSDVPFLSELVLYGAFVEVPERLFFRRMSQISVNAYPTVAERMAIFEPAKAGRIFLPRWRQLGAHLAGIRRASLPLAEELRCYARMNIWLRRWGETLAEDLEVAARQLVARGRAGAVSSRP